MSSKKYKLAILNSHPIQYFAPMYKRLSDDKSLDVTVYYCSRQGVEEYEDIGFNKKVKWDIDLLDGYRHKFLPNLRKNGDTVGFFKFINPSIVSELRNNKFDALWIHGHSYATYQIAVLAALLFRIPIFMRSETHLLLARSRWKRILRRPIMTLFYKACHTCLAIGTRNAEFYRYHGVAHEKIKLVPYTVDNQYFMEHTKEHLNRRQDIQDEYGIKQDAPTILYASKLSQRKNPMHLLQAYARIRQNGIRANLLFVGSGVEEDKLKKYVSDYDIQDVYFLGFCNQSELPKLYAISDMFVLPSRNEPWGLVINEAMCAGLPIVACDEIGAVADLVKDSENGFTFPAGDVGALAVCLEKLCSDANLRMPMATASLELITHWSYEQVLIGIKEALMFLDVPHER